MVCFLKYVGVLYLQCTILYSLNWTALLGTSGNATNANVAPLVDELTQALGTASAALNALNVPGLTPIAADPDLVAVVEGIIAVRLFNLSIPSFA